MSEDKHFENDPERTLITLEQLSQTIEVMTSVVNRLRQHLSEQLHAQMEEQQEQKKVVDQQKADLTNADLTNADLTTEPETLSAAAVDDEQKQQLTTQETTADSLDKKKESFVVEIRQQHSDPNRKNGKTLH
jgi:CO dehydrogenase nickel-insertion accessory protein CooC1